MACVIDWALTLEYLKVFLSWPVVVLIIVLVVIWKFKQSFSDFLSRLTKGEGYGVKLEAMPPQQQVMVKDLEKPTQSFQNENEQWVAEHPKEVLHEFHKVSLELRYEKAFNIIYGTQIDMLEWLAKKADAGDAYTNMSYFHNEHQARAKNSDYLFQNYMHFMELFEFIELFKADGKDMVRITPFSQHFLSYIKANYQYTFNKKPF